MDDTRDSSTVRAQQDPVTRWLGLVAGLLVIVVLTSVVAYTLYLRSIQAPRTVLEREIARYEELVSRGTALQEDYLGLAQVYFESGRTAEAEETLDRAYEFGETALIVLGDARFHAASDRHEEAVELFNRAEELAVAEYARILADLKNQQIVEEPPNTTLARVLFGRALSLRELGQDARALEDLEAAMFITPTDAVLLVAMGDTYTRMGQLDVAKEAYSRALELVPDYPEALAGLRDLEAGGE